MQTQKNCFRHPLNKPSLQVSESFISNNTRYFNTISFSDFHKAFIDFHQQNGVPGISIVIFVIFEIHICQTNTAWRLGELQAGGGEERGHLGHLGHLVSLVSLAGLLLHLLLVGPHRLRPLALLRQLLLKLGVLLLKVLPGRKGLPRIHSDLSGQHFTGCFF